jgi:hypothetical protein
MSMIQDVNAEQLARIFHHYQEALAQDDHAHATETETRDAEGATSWERTPQNERKLMVAAARLTLLELSTAPAPDSPTRKYYAKHGEADWGC